MSIWFFIIPFTLAAALPGPAQGALIAQVLTRGGRSTLTFILGMVAGNSLWLVAAISGLSALALRFEAAFVIVKWLGVAYLLFIAWKLWTSAPDGIQAQAGGKRGLLAGMLLTLGNPKAVVFFGAVLPQAFDLTALSVSQIAVIVALGLAIDLGVQVAYLMVAARARAFIRSPRQMRAVNRSAAGLMAGSAALIAMRS
ncbi:threonine/homoserine/homoserine lactone efflux protein [Rhizobium sp. BK212]|uniref:LysE family translocator n=1 Tax=Rhizobium TaxID=379 RepID=UPI000BE801D9|nr:MULTISPECIES: LysE family translocator [Rhizobium]MBB4218565.1 threonine/homoserine/homoserine lactone efflux protein [Rhizobium sp. BK212]PDS39142.1 amino acid transporter [Rhizobium anhuiense]